MGTTRREGETDDSRLFCGVSLLCSTLFLDCFPLRVAARGPNERAARVEISERFESCFTRQSSSASRTFRLCELSLPVKHTLELLGRSHVARRAVPPGQRPARRRLFVGGGGGLFKLTA